MSHYVREKTGQNKKGNFVRKTPLKISMRLSKIDKATKNL